MLTRRHIRVKVLQTLYAIEKNQSQQLNTEQKKLSESMHQMYRLYLLQMSMFVELHQMAAHLIEVAQKKYLPTSADKNPNRRFIKNAVLQQIVTNEELLSEIELHKANLWYLDDKYVKLVYQQLISSELYKNYMNAPQTSFEEDKFFLIDLYTNHIANNDKIYDYIEDHQLTWGDDFPWVNTLIIKTLKKTSPTASPRLFTPRLFKEKEDQDFAHDLLAKTALNSTHFQEYINPNTPNWDSERIAALDTLIIKMAICEFLKFPSIPTKVTINEYLEIAKEYSTSKSSLFINGILDKLVKEFQQKNMIKKTGRGLL